MQVRFNDLKTMEKIDISFTSKPSVFLQNLAYTLAASQLCLAAHPHHRDFKDGLAVVEWTEGPCM